MERSNPVAMRKAVALVESFKKIGMLFIPVPVYDDDDHEKIMAIYKPRFEEIIRFLEKKEG